MNFRHYLPRPGIVIGKVRRLFVPSTVSCIVKSSIHGDHTGVSWKRLKPRTVIGIEDFCRRLIQFPYRIILAMTEGSFVCASARLMSIKWLPRSANSKSRFLVRSVFSLPSAGMVLAVAISVCDNRRIASSRKGGAIIVMPSMMACERCIPVGFQSKETSESGNS